MRADHEITLAQRRVNTALSLKRVPIKFNRLLLRSPRSRNTTRQRLR
jgi:hypothetical protein